MKCITMTWSHSRVGLILFFHHYQDLSQSHTYSLTSDLQSLPPAASVLQNPLNFLFTEIWNVLPLCYSEKKCRSIIQYLITYWGSQLCPWSKKNLLDLRWSEIEFLLHFDPFHTSLFTDLAWDSILSQQDYSDISVLTILNFQCI